MQSPKSPEYRAGYRSTSRVFVTPLPFVPCIVSVDEAALTGDRNVLNRAMEETSAVDHEVEMGGKRAMFLVCRCGGTYGRSGEEEGRCPRLAIERSQALVGWGGLPKYYCSFEHAAKPSVLLSSSTQSIKR
jgi:hypothetical protein